MLPPVFTFFMRIFIGHFLHIDRIYTIYTGSANCLSRSRRMGKHRPEADQQPDCDGDPPSRSSSRSKSKRKKDKSKKKKEKKSKSHRRHRERSPAERKRRHRRSSSKSASPSSTAPLDPLKSEQRKRRHSSRSSSASRSPAASPRRHRRGCKEANSRSSPEPRMPGTGRPERSQSSTPTAQIPLPSGPPPTQQTPTAGQAQAPPPPPPPPTSLAMTAVSSPLNAAPAPQAYQLNPSAADFVPQFAFTSPPPPSYLPQISAGFNTPTILSPPANFSVPPPVSSASSRDGGRGSNGGPVVTPSGDRSFDRSYDAEPPAELPEEFLQLGGNLMLSRHYREPDSSVSYYPSFLSRPEADHLFRVLLNELEWRQRDTLVRGEYHREPRLTCWFGVPYTYSGVELQANHVWHPLLADLKDRLVQKLDARFNSLLCNLYRSGRDSIGWHADDEKSLGRYPVIASISLGYERQFEVKTKRNPPKFRELNEWGRHLRLPLRHGSLLVMRGAMQMHWLHSVPKDQLAFNSPNASRINLTFRYTHPD